MKKSTIDTRIHTEPLIRQFMILFADVLDIAWKVALIALSVHIITLENFY
jgi:hypothetical protein